MKKLFLVIVTVAMLAGIAAISHFTYEASTRIGARSAEGVIASFTVKGAL